MNLPVSTGITRTFTVFRRCRCWEEPRARLWWRESSAPIRKLAGLPERVFVIRDQDLLTPDAVPADGWRRQPAPVVLDRDGDARNTGTGSGKPAKDLSINFVAVPYPDYPPAVIAIKPGERQLWRVLNASAITYLNLQVLIGGAPQNVGVVALDGVPIIENGIGNGVILENHLGLPPGGPHGIHRHRPPKDVAASLVTRSVEHRTRRRKRSYAPTGEYRGFR